VSRSRRRNQVRARPNTFGWGKKMSGETVLAFKEWAATYDSTVSGELERFAGISHEASLDRMLQLARIETGARVLDVGTGTGLAALRQAAEDPSGQVVGVDPTPEMLAQAVRNTHELQLADRVRLVQAEGTALPYPDRTFDAVISSLALHHTDVSAALDDMLRVLKPSGRVIIMDMGAPPAWRSVPFSWLMGLLRWVYALVGGVQGKAEAKAFGRTYTAGEWERILVSKDLMETQVLEVRRPGQRIYPCVIFAGGAKNGAGGYSG